MAVLEFRAVDLDDRARVAEKRLRHGFNHPGFTRSSGPKKEQVSHRAPGSVQSGKKHLVDFHHFFYGRVLANDLPAQSGVKIHRIRAAPCGIKCSIKAGPHKFPASFRRGPLHIPRGKCEMEMEAEELSLLIGQQSYTCILDFRCGIRDKRSSTPAIYHRVGTRGKMPAKNPGKSPHVTQEVSFH